MTRENITAAAIAAAIAAGLIWALVIYLGPTYPVTFGG